MGRWTQYDEDEYRLPEGTKRVGYDADTQRYTFQNGNKLWLGEPGVKYGGRLTRGGTAREHTEESVLDQNYPVRSDGYQALSTGDDTTLVNSNKKAYRMFLPFGLLVCVFLLFVWRFFIGHSAPPHHQQCVDGPGMTKYIVNKGDTCWSIAQDHGISLETLRNETLNPGLNCDQLRPRDVLCLPPNKP